MHLMHCPKITGGSEELGSSRKMFLSKSVPHLAPPHAAVLCAITTHRCGLIVLRHYAHIWLRLRLCDDIKRGRGTRLSMGLRESTLLDC